MRFSFLAWLAFPSSCYCNAAPSASASDLSIEESRVAELATLAYKKSTETLPPTYSKKNRTRSSSSQCSLETLRVRREWGTLSKKQRKSYIKAVQCLQQKPALTPSTVAAGAKSRFDDFVATHINQTLTIHYTANFLSWHRYFTWLYEEALRKECGYEGDQPYWNWALTAQTGLLSSPLFSGSTTSMSGNGAPLPNQTHQNSSTIILGASTGLPPIYLPIGTGGGCLTSGPFANMTVNLGPAALDSPGGITVGSPSGNPLDYNPRCLTRDLVDEVNQRYANSTSILRQILEPEGVYDFQMLMQGIPGSGSIGVHGGGHYSLGGDPGRDVYASPGDPMFYLHHAMIDRVWWIWQMLDPGERVHGREAIAGTRTFLNSPESANATVENWVEFGFAAGPKRRMGELMSTTEGPFCYVYA